MEKAGEEIVRVRAEGHGECLAGFEFVARGPGDPADEGEGRRGVLAVGTDAAAGQGSPQAQGGACLVALHPRGGAVASRAVLETEDEPGRFVVGEEVVVAQVRGERAGDGRCFGQALHHPLREFQGLVRDLRAGSVFENPRDQGHAGGVEGDLLFQGGSGLPGEQPGAQLTQGAAHLEPGVGGCRGQYRGAGQTHRGAARRAAAFVGAAVRPEAAFRDAQGLDHRYIEVTALDAQFLCQRPQAFHDLSAALARCGLLAEEGHDLLGSGAPAFAARDQSVGQLPGRGRPVVRVGGDAEPGPPAEAAAAVPVVQGDQDDAVLGAVTQQIRQRVGQFGRGAQGDLLFAAVAFVGGAVELVRGVRLAPRDVAVLRVSSGFTVIRHGKTISRIAILRFALWITQGRDMAIALGATFGMPRPEASFGGPARGTPPQPTHQPDRFSPPQPAPAGAPHRFRPAAAADPRPPESNPCRCSRPRAARDRARSPGPRPVPRTH